MSTVRRAVQKFSFEALPRWTAVFALGMACLSGGACGSPASDSPGAVPPGDWQPFTPDSPWNLKLPPSRMETPIPPSVLSLAPFALSDQAYGIKIYFASASDPEWAIDFDTYNSFTDNWDQGHPLRVHAPQVMLPPTGSDGSVLLVDENRAFAYEMWRFTSNGTSGHAATIDKVDLKSKGMHHNVGITAAGLPGIGGVLRASELKGSQTIRHKIWLAVNPAALFAHAVWPAVAWDAPSDGAVAFLNYGDVVALSKSYQLDLNDCRLSPFLLRIAAALQDFGGIVQDRGDDSIGMECEVNAIRANLDTDVNTMWTAMDCLKKYLVKVNNPW